MRKNSVDFGRKDRNIGERKGCTTAWSHDRKQYKKEVST